MQDVRSFAREESAAFMPLSSDHFMEKLLTLRVAVAFLGERDQFAWWTTRFLGTTGLKFLDFNFPRSAFAAGITAASEAAKNFHDRRIGKGDVCHLFRLPHTIEQRLRALLFLPDKGPLLAIVADKEAALRALSDLSNKPNGTTEGPVCFGSSRILSSPTAISNMAAVYAGAFERAKQTLPYYIVER